METYNKAEALEIIKQGLNSANIFDYPNLNKESYTLDFIKDIIVMNIYAMYKADDIRQANKYLEEHDVLYNTLPAYVGDNQEYWSQIDDVYDIMEFFEISEEDMIKKFNECFLDYVEGLIKNDINTWVEKEKA